jgi:hypothetical protein
VKAANSTSPMQRTAAYLRYRFIAARKPL